MSPTHQRRRLRGAAIIALASLVLLELALQAGALVLWWSRPAAPAAGDPDANTVLCVGDSWTQGMGCSDPATRSYPAVAQRVLRQRPPRGAGAPWTLVNAGLAGRNSYEMLAKLPGQLRRYRPRVVAILVGQNDFWSMPPLLAEGRSSAEGFAWRWRTLRLLTWARGKLRGRGQAGAEGLPTGGAWAPRQLEHRPPYPLPDAPWATNAAASTASKRRGWRLQASGDAADAAAAFEAALALAPDDPQARAALIAARMRLGDGNSCDDHLEQLREQWAASGDYWTAVGYASSLQALGRYAECLPLAEQLCATFPASGSLWGILARCRFKNDDVPGAIAAIDRALATGHRIEDHGWRAKFCQLSGDIEGAFRALIAGYLEHNDAPWLAQRLRTDALRAHGDAFARLADAADCAPDVRERLRTIAASAFADREAEVRAILRQHLLRAARLCRAHGAEPVFLTYPHRQSSYDVQRGVASEVGATFIDVAAHFAPVIRARTWKALRAQDGHCNDDGYEVMGQCVAAGLTAVIDKL